MAYIRARIAKASGLDSTELVALRSVSQHKPTEGPVVKRLETLGLVKRSFNVWDLTEQGRICLMFAAAR
jgi:hypothetical protein